MGSSTDINSAEVEKKLAMDCSRLISFMAREEASLPETENSNASSSGSPIIELSQLLALGKPYCKSDIVGSGDERHYKKDEYNSSVYLAVARSDRVCCCQVLSWNRDGPVQTEPIMLWCSLDDDYQDEYREVEEEENEDVEESITSSLILTCPSISSSASSIVSNDTSSMISSVIVLGTSKSRILSIELNIDLDEMDIARTNIIQADDYYEPLPFMFPRKAITSDLDQSMEREDSKNDKEDSKEEKNDKTFHTFHPLGGVSSIFAFRKAKTSTVFVWVSYMDGTAVQLHDRDFFKSLLSESKDNVESKYPKTRVSIGIPHLANFFPLPTSHTSILAPIPTSTNLSNIKSDSFVFQALSYGGDNGYNNAHDPTKGGASVSFYSSEDHSSRDPAEIESEQQLVGLLGGYVLGGAKSIVSGVSTVTSSVTSSIVGAMKWGWNMGSTSANVDDDPLPEEEDSEDEDDIDLLLNHPNKNFLTEESPRQIPHINVISDPPRRISSVSVDPTGKFATIGDSLGRVLLIDLKSKQIVRMWKGLRESQCYWIQQYHSIDMGNYKKRQIVLYLVVHAKQRSIIEIWRMKHGGRVKVLSVEKKAHVLQCWESNGKNYNDVLAKCYLLHSPEHKTVKIFEPIMIDDKDLQRQTSASMTTTTTSNRTSLLEEIPNNKLHPNIHLKLLQQMLASDTNIPSNSDAVFSAVTKIRSMADLSKALDLLAVANSIEEKMNIKGSSFHAKAIEYCQQFLNNVESEEGNEGITHENPHAINLRKQIEYQSMVVQAYDVLNRYEIGMQDDDAKRVDEDNDSIAPRTSWSVEAIKWIETHDSIHGIQTNLDSKKSSKQLGMIRFSAFSKACSSAKSTKDDTLKVHFCDSTKDRKAALMHVFHPFLQDIFVFNVVNSIFEKMGISDDLDNLLKVS